MGVQYFCDVIHKNIDIHTAYTIVSWPYVWLTVYLNFVDTVHDRIIPCEK